MSNPNPTQDKDISTHIDEPQAEDPHRKALEPVPLAERIKQQHADLYIEALERYGEDGSIDPEAEKRLKRCIRFVAQGPSCDTADPAVESSTCASCRCWGSATSST
jgi:hypothetical protein